MSKTQSPDTSSPMVDKVIFPKIKDLGDGFEVRRCLPHIKQRMVGPFIFWDHMGPTELTPERPMVVRAHPHIGLSTITYLFKGEITHRDSLGNDLVIRPGEVNWMTSGHGIVHSERSHPTDNMPLEAIQLWVALPKDSEDVEPSFVHHKEKDLPVLTKGHCLLRLIAGQVLDHKSPLPVYSDLFYLAGQSKGGDFSFPVEDQQQGAIYIIRGTAKLGDDHFEKYTMVVFKVGQDLKIEFSEDCEFMILGGTPFEEKRHLWWNFVSSDPQKIEQAKLRWQNNAFDSVINENQRIPLPEN